MGAGVGLRAVLGVVLELRRERARARAGRVLLILWARWGLWRSRMLMVLGRPGPGLEVEVEVEGTERRRDSRCLMIRGVDTYVD